ncbi:putative RNase H-like nuclease (RuvC/YqgF family) [Methanohalophilus levihalophilus]|nr:hypothetical protein [Methanohalophilus levihalophilus]MBP2029519.1 putative RNase H-like nuclease (RuvC/YqgF family) [Methanohalophilus levihalophilus]
MDLDKKVEDLEDELSDLKYMLELLKKDVDELNKLRNKPNE